MTHFSLRGCRAELTAKVLACSHRLIEKALSALALAAFICPICFCSSNIRQLKTSLRSFFRRALIARGRNGLQVAWIPMGSGEFRIYTQTIGSQQKTEIQLTPTTNQLTNNMTLEVNSPRFTEGLSSLAFNALKNCVMGEVWRKVSIRVFESRVGKSPEPWKV